MLKKWIVEKNQEQKKVIRFLSFVLNLQNILPLQKALKNKDIKVNGKRINKDIALNVGDEVSLFLPDKFITNKNEPDLQHINDMLRKLTQAVIYEDKQIIVLNKPQGLTVHPGANTQANSSLIELLRRLWKNDDLTLAHRLDRNTGGLVLIAKNKKIAGALALALKTENLVKRYHCIVKGVPEVGESVILNDGDSMLEVRAFLEKSPNNGEVFIHENSHGNNLPIITRYRVLRVFTSLSSVSNEPLSELEVELVTGRTHQIRAHLAFLNHPILGDGKYGRNDFNLKFSNRLGEKIKFQQLFATSLLFGSTLPPEIRHLKNKTFKINPAYDLNLKN